MTLLSWEKAWTLLHILLLERGLSQSLTTELWSQLQAAKNQREKVCRSVKQRQRWKFEQLKSDKTTQTPPQLDPYKLVFNLSGRQLIPQEKEVLILGLSFTIAPRQVPYNNIIAATELTARRHDPTAAYALRLAVCKILHKVKPPKPNQSYWQCHTIQELRSDQNIVILPADKGKVTVIMDKEDYIRKMRDT